MPQDTAMNKSFPKVRMTGFRFVVILTEGKDLFVASRDYVLQIQQHFVMNRFFTITVFHPTPHFMS